MLTFSIGAHEGLYLARARHGSDEQEGCISRDRGMMPNLCDRLSMVVPQVTKPSSEHCDTSLAGFVDYHIRESV